MTRWWTDSSIRAHAAPFIVFIAFLAARGAWPEVSWLYGVGAFVVAVLLYTQRRHYVALGRGQAPSPAQVALSIAVGGAVCVLWVWLDAPWMTLGEPAAVFVPVAPDGHRQWGLIATRWAGAALLVPVMEELFWRSFLMRWLQSERFADVDPRAVGLKAIVGSTLAFMLVHTLWLAAIVAGLAYAWLYVRTGRLWCAVIAHAVTNGALGVWVVANGQWQFW